MRIVVDQDEVLFQFVNRVLQRWNAARGTNYTSKHINMWHMEDTLGPGSVEFIDALICEPGFFDDLDPVPGAVEGFNELIKMGHDVVVATSIMDHENVFDGKRRSMKKHFPGWPMKNFITCSRKGLLTGDFLIDDGTHNIEDWLANDRGTAIVFDAPWNQGVQESSSCLRFRDWDSIVEFFRNTERFSREFERSAAEFAKMFPPQNNQTPWK